MSYSRNDNFIGAIASEVFSLNKLLVLAMLCGSTYAQAQDQTDGINLTTEIVTPVSINCGTALNFGNIDIKAFASLNDQYIFWRPGQTIQGSAVSSAYVAMGGSPTLGECTISNVPDPSSVTVEFSNSTIDITNGQATQAFDLFVRDEVNGNFGSQVTYAIDTDGSTDPSSPTGSSAVMYTAPTTTGGTGTLVFQVGGSLMFDFDYAGQTLSQGDLVGTWTGSATVEVTL